MEGRTIVRPDWSGSPHARSCRTPFNGGPDNRPARPGAPQLRQRSWQRPFNGGPDNRPARPEAYGVALVSGEYLQWRAGQSSGQTHIRLRHRRRGMVPSMEGRTIVRPDEGGQPGKPAATFPSMEGRTIVRPDGQRFVVVVKQRRPSMEGRTIVRPDLGVWYNGSNR